MSEEIPPGTGLIDSIRAEKSPYHSWAGEAIDNALDAQASLVELKMSKESLDARDNGIGITKDRDQAIVKISQHGEMSGTKLGRFGVGIKYKSIQHGEQFHVHSISADGRLRRTVDWQEMRRIDKWMYPAAVRTEVPVGVPTGTLVSIRGLITKAPTKTDIDKTRSDIERMYYPALNAGRVITLNGEAVSAIAQPALRDEVKSILTFPEGREAHIRAGMLVDSTAAKLRQVDVCVAYRVIKKESPFGCNGYGGIRSMFARIDLIGPWKLTKFKDDIAEDPFLDDLQAGAEDVLRPILEKCQSASMFLKSKRLEQLLNEMIPEDHRMTRPLKKQDLGRKGPKKGEKTVRDAPNSEPSRSGPTQKKRAPPGIFIEFADGLHATHGYGRCQVEKTSTRIQLATDNPHISVLMNCRDEQNAAIALYAIASCIYHGDSPPKLVDEPFGLRAWTLAGQQTIPQSDAA